MEIPILILGVSLAWALFRGRLGLSLPKWRGGLVLLGALLVQVYFVAFPPRWMGPNDATLIYLASQALVATFLILNRSVSGVTLVAVGLGLNALVVGANGAMPVSSTAIEIAGAEAMSDARHVEHGVHLRNEPMSSGTRLRPLADVIPISPFHVVVSLGDIAVGLGLVYGVLSATQVRDRAPRSTLRSLLPGNWSLLTSRCFDSRKP